MSLPPSDEAAALRSQAAALLARADELDPPVPDPIPATTVVVTGQSPTALSPLAHLLDTAALLSNANNPRSTPEILTALIRAVDEIQGRA